MRLCPVTVLLVMVPVLAIPAVAQSSSSGQPGASAQLFGAPSPTADSRARLPALSHKLPKLDGIGGSQALGSAILPAQPRQFKLNMRNLTLQLLKRKTFEIASAGAAVRIPPAQTRGCYTVRTYRFERDALGLDATSFKESYACAPAAQFQAKSIVGPLMNRAIQPIIPVR